MKAFQGTRLKKKNTEEKSSKEETLKIVEKISDTDSRIILLSIQNAASGANLTRATHVLLIDPAPGSTTEAYAAEKQAIGRAVRQGMDGGEPTRVVRFVVSNTIEEETYLRNKATRNKTTTEEDSLDDDGVFRCALHVETILACLELRRGVAVLRPSSDV